MSADCELVSAYVREGSETAFRALVTRHVNLVYATALRQTGDAGIAEEVTQNVFVVLARKAPRLSGIETLAGWLHRTAVLESKSRVRAELRRQRRDETAAALASIQHEGASTMEALVPLLDEGLLNLRDGDRLALVLRFFEERSLRDVGAELGVDEDAARKRVSRALDRLTEFFRTRGFAAGTGAAALMTGAVNAAPATLVVSAGNAGLAAGTAASSLQLFIFHLMSATKTQTAVACALLAAAPLAWQWRAQGKVAHEQAVVAANLTAARLNAGEVEQHLAGARNVIAGVQGETVNLQARLVQVNAQRSGRLPRRSYQWDDDSPVVRVPKELIAMVPMSSVKYREGLLTDQIKEALQLSETEATQVQTAMDGFISKYNAAQLQNMRAVEPGKADLSGHTPEETRVFEMTSIGTQLDGMRRELLRSTASTLGPDRFKIFQNGLADWMPLDDEDHGLSTSMCVLNFDRRERYYQPKPGDAWIDWSLSSADRRSSINCRIPIDHISGVHRAQLQDWIALAKSKPSEDARP